MAMEHRGGGDFSPPRGGGILPRVAQADLGLWHFQWRTLPRHFLLEDPFMTCAQE